MKGHIKKFIIISISIFLELSTITSAYANDKSSNCFFGEQTTFSNEVEARASFNAPRGALLSRGDVGLTNMGEGVMEVYMSTTCHVAVDRILMVVYVDKLNEESGQWEQQEYKEFEFLASDTPGEDLSMAIIDSEVTGYELNCYYRLRGLHGVWKDGRFESFSTETAGLKLTKYPG